MPQVSIIIPIYNVGEELLRPCIESALAQTFRDFELILVDDASANNAAAVCASYAYDERVRLLQLPKNGGVSNARNKGIAIAAGNYITFLDADDRLYPEALMKLYEAADKTKADIVTADFVRVGIHNAQNHLERISHTAIQIFSPEEAAEDVFYQHTLDNSPWAKLLRRELCASHPFPPGRYEDLRIVPQWYLAANKVAHLSEKIYVYTDNPASYTNTFNLGRAVVLDVTEELVEYMEANYPELSSAAHDRALSAAFNIFNLLIVHKVDAPEIKNRCKSTIRRYRRESLLNPKVRIKNKIGILLTYIGGFSALKIAAKFFQRP